MKNELKEKYGLFTAIAMVVGIVIGSGVFFKAEKVLNATGGNLPLGILAWVIGAAIMVICAYTFAVMATHYSGVNGLADYAEATVGRPYAYAITWFTTFMYFPAMTSVLAWVSARYIGVLCGFAPYSGAVMTIAGGLLIASYALNTLSPILAGKFQVSTTVIKLIPLIVMAIVGTIVGLLNGMTVENFTTVVRPIEGGAMTGLFSGLVGAAFAFEGWIIATGINAEIKNSKRNLPIALVAGTLIIALVYILYYIGLAGGIATEELMASGEKGVQVAFQKIFGSAAGVGLFVLVIISCLGTLNGLMLATTRSMYAISVRGNGPRPALMSEVSAQTNMPTHSAVLGLTVSAAWLVYFFGAIAVTMDGASASWFGMFSFDSSELPIVTIYAMYIPIFVMLMVKEKSLSPVKRFVFPALAIVCCLFMSAAAVIAHKQAVLGFLVVFAVIMLAAVPFYRKKSNQTSD